MKCSYLRCIALLIIVFPTISCAPTPSTSLNPTDAASDSSGDAGACLLRSRPALTFEKRVLDDAYRAEGVGAFDVNGDGRPDIVTEQYWYDGRDLSPNELSAPLAYDRAGQYARAFGAYAIDGNGDGCPDVLVAPHPMDQEMLWYQNPCGAAKGRWAPHSVVPTGIAGLETPFLFDLFGDGKPVLLSSDSRAGHLILGWYEPVGSDPWTLHPISRPGFEGAGAFIHGIGVGDLDGDHDLDVLTSYGWFENTGDRSKWVEHLSPNPFPPPANACSRMWTYDVNCDGLADVLCSRPHEVGIHWFEQRPVAPGAERAFVDHIIDETVTQMHALRLADLDGDGVPEIVSGTRWCAHCSSTNYPDPAIAYLVYYSLRREGGVVSFDRHVIDESSGVGAAFDIADIDGDGKPDIVTANKHGLFYFRQIRR